MANPEHLEILKQGVEVWNKWRESNPEIIPDLSDCLLGIDHSKANLDDEIDSPVFTGCDFRDTNFSKSDLSHADMSFTNCEGSTFFKASLSSTNFSNAILRFTNLISANLSNSDLSSCDLTGTYLHVAYLAYGSLIGANFTDVELGMTTFSNCDLSQIVGLDTVIHERSSSVGIETFFKSGGKIPEVFLRGCGVPEDFIVYAKSLTTNPIEYYSCFISFTEKDDTFSERLYNDMQAKGIRCWRWKEDAKWGRTLRKEIDEAVRYYDKLVVICSKDSLNAPAVLEEIERALDKEDAQKRSGEDGEVLFPIRIDDFIFDGWEHELKVRLTRKNIGDFCDWNSDAEKYRKSVERLVRDLNRPRVNK